MTDILAALHQAADLLEIAGANPFRVNAFRRGARALRPLAKEGVLEERSAAGTLTDLDGVGKGIAGEVAEIIETGASRTAAEALLEVPAGLMDVLRVEGVGPKSARRMWQGLGVETLHDLEAACRTGRVAEMKGFGERSAAKILCGIGDLREFDGRWLLTEAWAAWRETAAVLGREEGLVLAGGARRFEDTVRDAAVVARSRDRGADGGRLESEGWAPGSEGRWTKDLGSGLPMEVVLVAEKSFGRALLEATGPEEFVRDLAERCGKAWGGKAEDESALFAAAGVPYVPPERRHKSDVLGEDHGHLVELADLVVDLHCHTQETDGTSTVEDMVAEAVRRGLSGLAVTDHSVSTTVANGMDADRAAAHRDRIRGAKAPDGFRVLAGVEVDILADGALDLPDDLLGTLDWRVGSVHAALRQKSGEMTKRLVRAVSSGRIDVVGHPTGRILCRRKASDFDRDKVFAACAEHGVALEINAQPSRLDLSAEDAEAAVAAGCRVTISSDAHAPGQMEVLRFGVGVARRAGLGAADVVNCEVPG